MGCQKKIVEQIRKQDADYVVALKENQKKLFDEVVQLFEQASAHDFEGLSVDYDETRDESHGRVEVRRYWTIADAQELEQDEGDDR